MAPVKYVERTVPHVITWTGGTRKERGKYAISHTVFGLFPMQGVNHSILKTRYEKERIDGRVTVVDTGSDLVRTEKRSGHRDCGNHVEFIRMTLTVKVRWLLLRDNIHTPNLDRESALPTTTSARHTLIRV